MPSNRYFHDESIEKVVGNARLLVFDLNGLILDDEPLQIAAVNSVLERYGILFDEETWKRRFYGRRSSEYLAEIMRQTGREAAPDLIRRLVAAKDQRYQALLAQRFSDSVFPGAIALLRHLHERGTHWLALATSASRAELDSALGPSGLGLLRMFDCVVCGEDVAEGKPDPETYARVASLTGIAPQRALVLEDSAIGVQAAVGARMPVVAVPNRFTASQDFTGAAMIISDLTPQATMLIPGGRHE